MDCCMHFVPEGIDQDLTQMRLRLGLLFPWALFPLFKGQICFLVNLQPLLAGHFLSLSVCFDGPDTQGHSGRPFLPIQFFLPAEQPFFGCPAEGRPLLFLTGRPLSSHAPGKKIGIPCAGVGDLDNLVC